MLTKGFNNIDAGTQQKITQVLPTNIVLSGLIEINSLETFHAKIIGI